MTLADNWDPTRTIMLLAGGLIVLFVLFRMNRQMLRRAGERAADRPSSQRAARAIHDVQTQLDELMAQLEELARATNAQIQTRAAKLEALLAEADQKIARLETLVARLNGRPAPADSAPDAVKPEHLKVYQLADAGKTPVQIAQDLARDVGEIELILALRKK